MKRNNLLKITAIVTMMTLMHIPQTILAIEGQVMRGEFAAQQVSEPLIGDFKTQLSDIVDIQLESAEMLEKAAQEFTDCDSRLGKNEIDNARYVDCVLTATQEGRSSYKQVRADFEKLDRQLETYRGQIGQAVVEDEGALHEERNNLRKDQKNIDKVKGQFEELIAKFETSDPNAALTREQAQLVYELADSLNHIYSMFELHSQAIIQLEVGLEMQREIEVAVNDIQFAVQRAMTSSKYREIESSEFIRITRLYGLSRARLLEGGEVVGMLNGVLPQISAVVENMPGYVDAMSKYGGTKGSRVRLAKPQTVGDAMAMLKSLLNKEGAENE